MNQTHAVSKCDLTPGKKEGVLPSREGSVTIKRREGVLPSREGSVTIKRREGVLPSREGKECYHQEKENKYESWHSLNLTCEFLLT